MHRTTCRQKFFKLVSHVVAPTIGCLWLKGLCRRLAQHQSKTRKLSIMASLLAGEPSLAIWSVVPLVRPSIHPRQDSMTQDAVPAARLDKHMLRGVCVCGQACRARVCAQAYMCTESKFSIAPCQHYTTAFSLHVFLALWAVLNQMWWLAVCRYKKKIPFLFSVWALV